MKALVVYGSTRGGTEEIASTIGRVLTEEGLEATVRPASVHAGDVGSYDVVVVGGALYMHRWHKDARRFVRREAKALSVRPVWLFSSGPLGPEALTASDSPPVPQVRRVMERVGARGHATFGGRLTPDAKGFPAHAMATTMAGDWRDEEAIERFAKRIAVELA